MSANRTNLTSSQDATSILASVSYFSGLDSQTFEAIARSARLQDYDPGQLVILEGEPASGLYVVQNGWLKVSKIAVDGRENLPSIIDISRGIKLPPWLE